MDVATTSTAVQSAKQMGVNTSDYETFLKMLTVQMQNQDPLNPVEASDFAAQLANFSAVEQQVLTNNLLTSIEARLAATGVSQLAGWVGMEVQSHAAVNFDGQPISVEVPLSNVADRRELVVRNIDGEEVFREVVPQQVETVTWGGEQASGLPAAAGLYVLEVESFAGETSLGRSILPTYSGVKEARIGASGVELLLEGGAVTPADGVLGLRLPI